MHGKHTKRAKGTHLRPHGQRSVRRMHFAGSQRVIHSQAGTVKRIILVQRKPIHQQISMQSMTQTLQEARLQPSRHHLCKRLRVMQSTTQISQERAHQYL